VQSEAWKGKGMCSHGKTVQETPGMDEGANKWTKAQAVAWPCAAMDEDAMVHEDVA